MRARTVAHVAAAGVIPVAAAVVTWSAIGQQTADGCGPGGCDYVVRPPRVDAQMVAIATVLSAAYLAAVVAVFLRRRTRSWRARRWGPVLLGLAALGVVIGASARSLTAGVIGANIGAGLVVLWGGPIIAAGVIWLVLTTAKLARQRVSPWPPPSPTP